MYSIFPSPYLAQQRMRPASGAKIAGRRGLEERRATEPEPGARAEKGWESRGTVASGWRGSDGGQLEWRLILQSPAGSWAIGTAQSLLEELQKKKRDEVVKRFLVL